MRHWVLLGGGHGHLSLLKELAGKIPSDVNVTLVTPHRYQWYSGMLPGYLAGHYRMEQCRIDLLPFLQEMGVQWLPEAAIDFDADRQTVRVADGGGLEYDLLSVNTGGVPRQDYQCLPGALHLSLKPFESFVDGWKRFAGNDLDAAGPKVVVVGAGAAGVEVAMALAHRFAMIEKPLSLTLVGPELLAAFPRRVGRLAWRELSRSGVEVKLARVTQVAEEYVTLNSGERLPCDLSIGATGAAPPPWLADTGLALDKAGFVEVDKCHRSLNHTGVFALGDICSRGAANFQRSGVHAVRSGPVVAHNMLARHNHQALKPYRPRPWTLYILSCGRPYAIANWGPFSLAGQWVWNWKNTIDTRFIASFGLAT